MPRWLSVSPEPLCSSFPPFIKHDVTITSTQSRTPGSTANQEANGTLPGASVFPQMGLGAPVGNEGNGAGDGEVEEEERAQGKDCEGERGRGEGPIVTWERKRVEC